MINYLIRRFIQMAIVLFFSSVAAYALLSLAPGGPLSFLGSVQRRLNQEDMARIRAYFEMDLSLQYRFSRWLIGVPRGPITIFGKTFLADFVVGCRMPLEIQEIRADGKITTKSAGCKEGQSVTMQDLVGRKTSRGVLLGDLGPSWSMLRDRPVSILVASRLPRTIKLMTLAYGISILIGVPLGVFAAVKQYSKFDYFVTSLAFFGTSMPTFFFGLLMILVFSILFKNLGLPYLPPGNAEAMKPYTEPIFGMIQPGTPLDIVLHLVLRQDYVRTARAKGLFERVVIAKHALRNALIPFITLVVFTLPALFAGAIITETVFNWPGMGRLYFDALSRNDYPVAMSLILITAVLTVIATLLSDILYTWADPRIRLS